MIEGLNGEITEKYIRRCHMHLRELNAPLEKCKCLDVIDGETDDFVCELCDYRKIRYIHVMVRPEYDGVIQAGCICSDIT